VSLSGFTVIQYYGLRQVCASTLGNTFCLRTRLLNRHSRHQVPGTKIGLGCLEGYSWFSEVGILFLNRNNLLAIFLTKMTGGKNSLFLFMSAKVIFLLMSLS